MPLNKGCLCNLYWAAQPECCRIQLLITDYMLFFRRTPASFCAEEWTVLIWWAASQYFLVFSLFNAWSHLLLYSLLCSEDKIIHFFLSFSVVFIIIVSDCFTNINSSSQYPCKMIDYYTCFTGGKLRHRQIKGQCSIWGQIFSAQFEILQLWFFSKFKIISSVCFQRTDCIVQHICKSGSLVG